MGKIIKKDEKPKQVNCQKCNGTGFINGVKCKHCKGTGKRDLLTD